MRNVSSPLLALAVWAALALGCAEALTPSADMSGGDCQGADCFRDTGGNTDVFAGDTYSKDTGVCTKNACGGCSSLPNRPGEACGSCGSYVCAGLEALQCNEGAGNACGGCAALSPLPGDSCGTCGTTVCEGKEATRCEQNGTANSCGGCTVLNGVAGQSCGDCNRGTWTCVSPNSLRCDGDTSNSCGGCTDLGGRVNDSCGPCGGGVYQCSGAEALNCVGGDQTNACGGCGTLVGNIGDACGECLNGRLACNTANSALVCAGESLCDPCAPTGGTDNNDTYATASNLGDFTDGDSWMTRTDWLYDGGDVDVFKAHVEDTTFAELILIAELSNLSQDYDLCVLWERDDGATPEITCTDSDLATIDGKTGCCSLKLGTSIETITLDDGAGGLFVNDSGTAYFRVFTYDTALACFDYQLGYGF